MTARKTAALTFSVIMGFIAGLALTCIVGSFNVPYPMVAFPFLWAGISTSLYRFEVVSFKRSLTRRDEEDF
jgi:hypothetical protein